MSRRISYGRMLVLAAAMCAIWAVGTVATAVASPVSVGTSGWFWGDPFPQGETLDQVAFQGAHGYAVGANGTVLRSDDGGVTWQGLASGTTANLTLLQEVDPNTIVVGGGCTVRESSDGGASFHRLAVDPSETSCPSNIAGLSFLTPVMGYVEQADGTVLVTSDGGQSVQQRTPVPLGGGTAEQIYFRTASLGFAVVSDSKGGRIYRTTDGAGSWTQVGAGINGEPLFSVYFATPTVAYAVGGGQTPTFAGPPAYNGTMVLLSEDEGKTWEERKPGSEPKSVKLPAGTPPLALRQIACSDPLNCLIATGTKSLVRTADGTVTGSLVTPSEASLSSLAFTTGLNVLAVGEAGATVLSPDGGATFPSQISHRLGVELNSSIRLGGSSQDAYVAGHAGAIAVTSDGGGEWGLVHVPTTANLDDVAFPTAQVGFAVDARGTVFRTANAGQTWAIEASVGEPPSRLLAPDPNTVLLVGPTGLRRSSDAGATFSPVAGSVVVGHHHRHAIRRSLSAFPLFAGAQLAGSAVIAWGDEAIESLDNGAHWSLIPRPLADGNVEAVSFLTPTIGYEVSRQRLFFTRNAGKRWTEISSLGTQALGGEGTLSFSSVQDGYALTAVSPHRNVLLRTADAGRTWIPETLPRHLISVAAGGASDYAAGEGALFATTDGGRSAASSTLTLGISGAHRISRARLKKAHGRVRLTGRLAPAVGGELVKVAYRTAGRAVWHSQSARVASNGSFSLGISGVTANTVFVAHWSGAGPVGGAGSPAALLTVTRR
jgi:photosystem II stability/assembly factor-like uncharacterized protein